jgi:hypothetical protein
VLRELSSVFVAWFVVFTLLFAWCVSQGPQRYERFLDVASHPLLVAFNVVALAFLMLNEFSRPLLPNNLRAFLELHVDRARAVLEQVGDRLPGMRAWSELVAVAPRSQPLIPPGGDTDARPRAWAQRSDWNAARSSATKSSGCSQAAKWPPFSSWL